MSLDNKKFGTMIDLLLMQKEFIKRHLAPGGVAVDFTMGNGHDTAFLSRTVGESGKVYAFDIQIEAIESTRRTLLAEGCPDNVTLIHDSHENAALYIKEPINAGMFNLGYMPGGDKTKTTMRSSTIKAVRTAIELLAPGGAITVAVYPGHAEGAAEGEELARYFATLDKRNFSCTEVRIINSPSSPYFTLVEKK